MLLFILLLPLSIAQINVSSPQAREIYEKARLEERETENEKEDGKREEKKAEKVDSKKEEKVADKKEEKKVEGKTEEKKEEKKEEKVTEKKEEKTEEKKEEKVAEKKEEKVEEKVEEKKEEPKTSTILPNNYGSNYQQSTKPYGVPAQEVKIKDISQGLQPLPSYGTPPPGGTPKPYGGDLSKQKINPYMP